MCIPHSDARLYQIFLTTVDFDTAAPVPHRNLKTNCNLHFQPHHATLERYTSHLKMFFISFDHFLLNVLYSSGDVRKLNIFEQKHAENEVDFSSDEMHSTRCRLVIVSFVYPSGFLGNFFLIAILSSKLFSFGKQIFGISRRCTIIRLCLK